jgi:hypothetical protein
MHELRQRAKKEFDYRASARQLSGVDPPLQIVHEHLDVELVLVHLAARPSHAPLSKTEDNWLQFFAGCSGMIFDSPLVGHRFPDDETGLFKLVCGSLCFGFSKDPRGACDNRRSPARDPSRRHCCATGCLR